MSFAWKKGLHLKYVVTITYKAVQSFFQTILTQSLVLLYQK